MASSAQIMMRNDAGGFGYPGFYHGLVSPDSEQQDLGEFIYDTHQGSWDTSTYLANTMHDDTLISPFATAFDQVSLMAPLNPSADADTQGDTFPPASVLHDQNQLQTWHTHNVNYPSQQSLVSPDGMSWHPPRSPSEITKAQQPSYGGSPVMYQALAHISQASSEQSTPTTTSARSNNKGKGTKKRRKAEPTNNEPGRRRNSHAVKPEPKSRRPSVAASVIGDTPAAHTEATFTARPQPSRRVSDMSQSSHISHSSPETAFSYSTTQDNMVSPGCSEIEEHPPESRSQRERNRAAATKCRAKNKRAISDLEEASRAVTEQREFLSAYAASLKNEVLTLKNELLRHGDCDCVLIQTYLSSMAQKVGQGTAGSGPSPPPLTPVL